MFDSTFDYDFTNNNNNNNSNIMNSSSLLDSSSILTTLSLTNYNRSLALKWIVRIIGGLLIAIGTIGNTLSALTLSRKKLRIQVTSIYLIALALSDLGNIFFSVLNFYLVRISEQNNMRLYHNIACKLHIFFTYYFINLSPTLLVAVSVQRYLAIAKHHYSKRHCTVKNAYIIITLIAIISFCIQLHWGIFYELKSVPRINKQNITYIKTVCNISSQYPTYLWFRSNIVGYLQWFFFTLCPFVIMLILNSLILKVIASAKRVQQRINNKNQRKKTKQRNMTIMLLSVSCVFILLTAPASTFMAFSHLFHAHSEKFDSLWIMFSLIYYTNTAANFLLYFLTADVFRQELRVMFFSLSCCIKLFGTRTKNSTTTIVTALNNDKNLISKKNGTIVVDDHKNITKTVNSQLLVVHNNIYHNEDTQL
ncbi:unnamed protein product [Didymodactylos carnosus]|uniref:G-protein coupled receptors family 1 profile domain-containing protein n=1 Tax=Didymodactylos carnosus TaxID=1234261 RepID=A0A814ZPT0_9BILA|nr:unnamed protein product [Didymodactylos carnosus]CAF4015865.1 unnamed protein product [Didymodactylos carnosus]